MSIHKTTVQEPYFTLLKTGEKTTEVRVFDGDRLKYRRFDILEVTNGTNKASFVIVDLEVAPSFLELFNKIGLVEILPGVATKKEALEVYRQWYSEEREKEHGVVGIKLARLDFPTFTVAGKEFGWDVPLEEFVAEVAPVEK